jgi:ribosomal protein S12 methylthiotransferase accessory factor
MGKYIGVIFKENFTMAEFKAQIYLLLGENEQALELLQNSENKLGHVVAELIRMDEYGENFREYKEALFNVFTQERVEKARGIIAGEEFLIDITLHNDYYNMLAMYDRLELKKRSMIL